MESCRACLSQASPQTEYGFGSNNNGNVFMQFSRNRCNKGETGYIYIYI